MSDKIAGKKTVKSQREKILTASRTRFGEDCNLIIIEESPEADRNPRSRTSSPDLFGEGLKHAIHLIQQKKVRIFCVSSMDIISSKVSIQYAFIQQIINKSEALLLVGDEFIGNAELLKGPTHPGTISEMVANLKSEQQKAEELIKSKSGAGDEAKPE